MTDPLSTPIADGGLVWRGETVVDVGPFSAMHARHPGAEVRSLDHHAVLPGLINAHDHGRALGTLRMGVSDAPLELWLPALHALPAVSARLLARYEGLLQLSSGITTTTHQHNPARWTVLGEELDNTAQGYADAGIRACIGLPLSDRNALSYGGDEPIYPLLPRDVADRHRAARTRMPAVSGQALIAVGRELRHAWRGSRHHWLCWGPVGPQWCSDALLGAVRREANPGEPIHIHVAETPRQVEFARRTYGTTPVRHLANLEFLGADVACAHCVWVDAQDREALAQAGATAVCNPSSNLRLHSGTADLVMLEAEGIAVALGLDGHALGDDQDAWTELRLAHAMRAAPGAIATPPMPGQTLAMAGERAARAVGGPLRGLGSLAAGHPADFIAIDLTRIKGPYHHPGVPISSLLLRRSTPSDVVLAVVDGTVCFDGRAELNAKLDEAGRSIADQLRAADTVDQRHREAAARAFAEAAAVFYSGWQRGS